MNERIKGAVGDSRSFWQTSCPFLQLALPSLPCHSLRYMNVGVCMTLVSFSWQLCGIGSFACYAINTEILPPVR